MINIFLPPFSCPLTRRSMVHQHGRRILATADSVGR